MLEEMDMLKICVQSGNWYRENDPEGSLKFILPEDVKEAGLKLVSAIGRSFRKKIGNC